MYDNYHFPVGADNEMAPWNEPIVPEKKFDITCSQSLSKTVEVVINNYNHVVEHESHNRIYDEYDDTSDTNWAEEYHSNDYHTPLQLIQLLGQVLMDGLKHGIVFRNPKFTSDLIKECEGWSEDETEYIEN